MKKDKLSLEELVTGYLEIYSSKEDKHKERFNAHFEEYERVGDIVRNGGKEAVELLLMLVEKAKTHWQLGMIGAGIIEDLLGGKRVEETKMVIEKARRDPKLCFAISEAWGDDEDKLWYELVSLPLVQKFRKMRLQSKGTIDTSEYGF